MLLREDFERLKNSSFGSALKKASHFKTCLCNLKFKIELEIQPQSKLNLTVCSQPDGAPDCAVDDRELSNVIFSERSSRLKGIGVVRQVVRQGRRRIGEVRAVKYIVELRAKFDVHGFRDAKTLLQS